MKFITCLLALFIASTACLTAGGDSMSSPTVQILNKGKDKSYDYNYQMPFRPLVNYTSLGHAYFFCPDTTYAYLAYPAHAEAIYGHYYSVAPYNTRAGLVRHISCDCNCD